MKDFSQDNIDFKKIINDEKKINKDVTHLATTVSLFTKFAWTLIILGVLAGAFALADKLFLNEFSNISGIMAWAVLCFLVLAGLFFIYTSFLSQKQQILMTHIETKFNEIELKTTHIEHEVLKARFEELHDSVKQERFESTFFQLLSVQNVIVNSLEITKNNENNESVSVKGRDSFTVLFQKFLQKARFVYDSDFNKIMSHYEEFYNENHAELGHYFGNLYHIIKFVDTSAIADKEKYINFVRAQLSGYELGLLFYNCLSKFGKESFKPLVEKYGLFKNIPKTIIIDPSHPKMFEPSAF